MALTHVFTNDQDQAASGTSIPNNSFSSAGYTHIVVWGKHEGTATTMSASDNKGTVFTPLTKISHSNNDLHSQLFWGQIGTPGTTHIATMNFLAARTNRHVAAWLINAPTLELDQETGAQGSGTSHDAGSLSTSAAAIIIMASAGYTTQTFTPTTGWTEDSEFANNFKGSRNEASAGTFDPAATATGNAAWAAVAAAFTEVGASPLLISRSVLDYE
jgi:hypothetical protein